MRIPTGSLGTTLTLGIVFVVVALTACESDSGGSSSDPIAIAGSWSDAYGSSLAITDSEWVLTMGEDTALFHVTAFSNEERWAIAENDPDNAYNPGQWSRFDWTYDGDVLYYCQTAYDAPSEEEARSAAPADPSDPSTQGCGGYAWTSLSAVQP